MTLVAVYYFFNHIYLNLYIYKMLLNKSGNTAARYSSETKKTATLTGNGEFELINYIYYRILK